MGILDAMTPKDIEDYGVSLYEDGLKPKVGPEEVRVFSREELDSALWLKIRGSLELMLEKYRIKNDSDLSELETADIRGRIKQVKEFLALGEVQDLEDQGDLDLGY